MRIVGLAALALASAAARPAVGATDPVEADFRQACLEGERDALKRSDTWAWIEDLCGRAALERAAAFRAAGRDGRLAMLAEDCADWYANNRWRLPERLARDATARRAHVDAVCRSEAEERLRRLGF